MKVKVIRLTEGFKKSENFLEKATRFIQKNVAPDEEAICTLSGGTDSSVVSMLFQRAIGENLHPIHIDTGFMRIIDGMEEPELVADLFGNLENFELIERRDTFYNNVFGIEDAETKRRAFRDTYVEVLNQKIEEIGASVMTQGTIKPDILETEGKIKSQNNVDTDFNIDKLVEPIAGLYKPDVRKVGAALGLPDSACWRQPFLGPGLSARTVGKIDRKKLENEKIANDLVERLVENYFCENYGQKAILDEESGDRIPFQYFTGTFDPEMKRSTEVEKFLDALGIEATAWKLKNRATGVREKGGESSRIYAPPTILEGDFGPEFLFYIGREISERFNTSRVLYKVGENEKGKWIVGIRAISSKDALFAEPLIIPINELRRFGRRIVEETEAKIAAYDITPKPPATIEFE